MRVSALKLGDDRLPVPRIAYRAQVYSVAGDELLWSCAHEHRSPIDAQTCGIQYLSDLIVGPPWLPRSA